MSKWKSIVFHIGMVKNLYILNKIAKIIRDSALTRSGDQVGVKGVLTNPLGEVTPPCPAK